MKSAADIVTICCRYSNDLHHGIEICCRYNDLHAKRPISLPKLPLQYADYAHWQKQFVNSPQFAEQLYWWKQNLAGVPELLHLPTDRPRPPQQTFRGSSYEYTLKGEVVRALHRLNTATGSSLYNTCLTAYKVLLALYSSTEDIVVGTSYAARPKGTEDMMGYMLNM
jgi:hypothetical protein